MFKFVVFLAVAAVAAAKPGLLSTHSVLEPIVVGATVHSAPSAVSHQSQTHYHSKTIVTPVVAPVIKSYVAAPVVHHHAVPVIKTLHAAPALHSSSIVSHVHQSLPVVKTVHSAHVLHAAPVVHSVHYPLAYGLHH